MSVLVHVIWPMEWKIASALARHCWIDWGRWAHGEMAFDGRCVGCCHRPHLGVCTGRSGGTAYACGCSRQGAMGPVADPSDAAAYRADCARRGVAPGAQPSMTWMSDGGLTSWKARSLHVRVRCGNAGYDIWYDGGVLPLFSCDALTLDEVLRVSEMARVVADVTRAAKETMP